MRGRILAPWLVTGLLCGWPVAADVVLESTEEADSKAADVIEKLRQQEEPTGEAPAEGVPSEEIPTEQPAPPGDLPLGQVERATFTTAVVNREPIDSIRSLTNDNLEVYYFTEFRGMTGRRFVHRWEFNGQIVAEVPFEIRGARWRVYSTKKLQPLWLGEWNVSVVDELERVLRTDTFSYTLAPVEPSPPVPMPSDEPEMELPEETPAAPGDVPE
jgi:hypothetical protein